MTIAEIKKIDDIIIIMISIKSLEHKRITNMSDCDIIIQGHQVLSGL